MALPTLAELKAYLRRSTTDEDTLLESLLASATANLEAYLDIPITAREIVAVDEAGEGKAVYSLVFPYYPIDEDGTVTIEDADGVEVDATAYRVDYRTGMIRRTRGNIFANGPYTITATAGWSVHPQYADLMEPVFRQAILDLAGELYAQRNAGATTEAVGSGIMSVYGLRMMPPRTERMLQSYRRRWVA